MEQLEEGDVVLCTVDRIVGTNVFVKIEGDGEGTITFSEVAPGRIRNIRDYVVPKKKIVCKVLRISGDRIDLSFRRVTQKEQKEVLEQHKQEKTYMSIIKSVLGDKAKPLIDKISEKENLYDFMEAAKSDPKALEKIAGTAPTKKILEIINAQKKKKAILKREITFTTTRPDGIELIKRILGKIKDAEVKYISAGKYSFRMESEDIKKADGEMKKILEGLEKSAKSDGAEFSILKK